jgi:uncharacterized membrane protein YphA (DoxX/SURF4 family)
VDFAAIGFRFFVGSVFLLAGQAKLPRQSEFEQVVRAYGVLPSRFVVPVARAVSLLEVAVATLLLIGLGTRVVAAVAAAALIAFSVAAGLNLIRGRDLDCGCYAVGAPRRITWALIARNAFLVAMAVVLALATPTSLAVDELMPGSVRTVAITHASAFALLLVATTAILALTLIAEFVRLRSIQVRHIDV